MSPSFCRSWSVMPCRLPVVGFIGYNSKKTAEAVVIGSAEDEATRLVNEAYQDR